MTEKTLAHELVLTVAEKCKEINRLKNRIEKLSHVLSLYVLGDKNGCLDDAGELGRKTLDELEAGGT